MLAEHGGPCLITSHEAQRQEDQEFIWLHDRFKTSLNYMKLSLLKEGREWDLLVRQPPLAHQ